MLNPENARVEIQYTPEFAIPYLTTEKSHCGFFLTTCFRRKTITANLDKEHFTRPDEKSIRFTYKQKILINGIPHKAYTPKFHSKLPPAGFVKIHKPYSSATPFGQWEPAETTVYFGTHLFMIAIRNDTDKTLNVKGPWHQGGCDETVWINEDGAEAFETAAIPGFFSRALKIDLYSESKLSSTPVRSAIRSGEKIRATHAKEKIDGKDVETVAFCVQNYTTAAGSCESTVDGRFTWVDGALIGAMIAPFSLHEPACSGNQIKNEAAAWWSGRLESYHVRHPLPDGLSSEGYGWDRTRSPYSVCLQSKRIEEPTALPILRDEAEAWR